MTCVWSSIKHSWMFFSTSIFNWEHIEPPAQESVLVPSLLWSHNEISLSRTVAILALCLYTNPTLPYPQNFIFKIHYYRANPFNIASFVFEPTWSLPNLSDCGILGRYLYQSFAREAKQIDVVHRRNYFSK